MSSDPIDGEPGDESGLIGAADIVAEFTALRHEPSSKSGRAGI